MTSRCKLPGLIAVATLCLTILPRTARADDASLGAVGFGVVPLDNNQVTMAAERIDAEIRGDQAWVTCVFTFTNTGPETEVLMGFPQARPGAGGEPQLRDFRAFVDGEEVPVTFRQHAKPEGERDYAGWHTFSVAFAGGETRTVRNSFYGRLTWQSNGGRAFEYMLHTGATWHGPIGQADVVVHWQKERYVAPETLSANPPGYTQAHHELHWHFDGLEPTLESDIRVYFRPVYGPHNIGTAAASSGEVQPTQTGHSLPAALFADGDPTTAWESSGETSGAWVIWSYEGFPHYATPTLGLGILPGVAGEDFRAHGRPKDVLIRLAQLSEKAQPTTGLPVVMPNDSSFAQPAREVEITQHRLALEDAPRWQFLMLDKPATVLAFQLAVQSVYPGEVHDDVAIAEVLFPVVEDDLQSAPALPPPTGAPRQLALAPCLALTAAILVAVMLRRPEKGDAAEDPATRS